MAHQKPQSREEIAKAEIGHTDSTPGVNWFLTLVFLTVIVTVPLLQTIREFATIRSGSEPGRTIPQSWEVAFFLWPQGQEIKAIVSANSVACAFVAARKMNNRMLRDITVYEAVLKDRDGMVQCLIPRMQTVITGWLKGGNEDAYCGREGWLFYRRDVDSLTGHGFLEPAVLKQRAATESELKAAPQPDPVKAIVDFRDQLARRGIALIVMPAPVKPSIHPEFYSSRYVGRMQAVQNPSFAAFKERLAKENVTVFDPAELLIEAKAAAPDRPLYLKTDTHWTPAAMELTAANLAAFVRRTIQLPPVAVGRFTAVQKPVEALGDVAMMLKLPPDQNAFPRETVQIRQVLEGERYWKPDPQAEVLFLGDSFANIFSLEPMGWGESAGFVEHLSFSLGLPLDAICRNDAGSHATRQMLAKELQRGNDRLAGKKVVIWEFASRELACGDWKLLPLTLGEKKASGFYVPEAGRTVDVRAVVRAVSSAPRPGSVPYKDHILTMHLTDIESADDAAATGRESVVFAWSMCDNKAMPASRYRPGDAVRLSLQAWSDVATKYEKLNRSELSELSDEVAGIAWAGTPGERSNDPSTVGQTGETKKGNPARENLVPETRTGQRPVPETPKAAEGTAARFHEICGQKAATGESMAVPGTDGWLFLRSELRHISVGSFWGEAAAKVSLATSPDKADPIPAIVDFNEQLKKLGIELIFMPVPCKALVYPEKLGGVAGSRVDTVHQEFYRQLTAKGIKVLDLTDAFLQEKARPNSPNLYCKTDAHWSPAACELAARLIKQQIGAPAWLQANPAAFKTRPDQRTITGDLTEGKGSEELPVRVVQRVDGKPLEEKASPILLMGDSHCLVFHAGEELHGIGAGLADQLALELGIAVDVVGVRGSGATPARVNLMRRARADAQYLAGKKQIIWCFAAREFTESNGWAVVKLVK